MSNKVVEVIKKGQKVTTEELFEVVNAYLLTTLSLQTPGKDIIISMQVNQFEKVHGDYKFSQQCTGYNSVVYMLQEDDLVSVDSEYNQKADAFYITCKLKNGMDLLMTIINLSGIANPIFKDLSCLFSCSFVFLVHLLNLLLFDILYISGNTYSEVPPVIITSTKSCNGYCITAHASGKITS